MMGENGAFSLELLLANNRVDGWMDGWMVKITFIIKASIKTILAGE